MDIKLPPLTQENLTILTRLDRSQGAWSAGRGVSQAGLNRLAEAARVQSVAASCRLAGVRVSDVEVAGMLRGDSVPLRDAGDVLGYAAALDQTLPGRERLLVAEDLCRLHALMMGGDPTAPPSTWRHSALVREAFDGEGKATGRIFSTLPPRMVREKVDELMTWLEFELRTADQHPVLVIGAFLVLLLAVSPFERGNGRLTRLLGVLLLRRAGYDHLRYASLESRFEELREGYHQAFDQAQAWIWTAEANLTPWLSFFLGTLDRQRERVEARIELERKVEDYPPLQRAILETVRDHGSVNAALLLLATGANRNTLKDNVRRLVERGVLEKTGDRRGTRYRIATGDHARPAMIPGAPREFH